MINFGHGLLKTKLYIFRAEKGQKKIKHKALTDAKFSSFGSSAFFTPDNIAESLLSNEAKKEALIMQKHCTALSTKLLGLIGSRMHHHLLLSQAAHPYRIPNHMLCARQG